jgi:AcrR family transcriptional regulator
MTGNSPSSIDKPADLGLRQRGKLEKRRRILDAARTVFAEKGFAATTTREIAVRADIGTGTLFLYVRDKHALLMMIVNDALDEMNEAAFASIPNDDPLIDQLLHVFSSHYDFWAADVDLSRHALLEAYGFLNRPVDGRPETERFYARRTRTLAGLTQIVRRKQLAARIDGHVDPALAAHLIFDIFVGENRKWLGGEAPCAQDGIVRLREVLNLAINGFGADPREARG